MKAPCYVLKPSDENSLEAGNDKPSLQKELKTGTSQIYFRISLLL